MRIFLLAILLTFSAMLSTGCKSTDSSTANSNNPNAKPADSIAPGTLVQSSPGTPRPGENPTSATQAVDPTGKGVVPVDSTGTNLTMLVMDFHSSRTRGDKTKLAAMLASDYKGTRADGTVVNKAQELASLKPTDDMLSMEAQPAKITGDMATVTSKLTLKSKDKPEQAGVSVQFIDTLRKRGDQWELVSSVEKKQ
jgi:hypothetical protein